MILIINKKLLKRSLFLETTFSLSISFIVIHSTNTIAEYPLSAS